MKVSKRISAWNLAAQSIVVAVFLSSSQPEYAVATTSFKDLKVWSTWVSPKHGDYSFGKDSSLGPPDAAKIESTSPDQEDGFASMFVQFSAHNYLGKKIKYSASIKTDKANGSAGLWMVDDKQEKVLSFDDMEGRGIKGTTDWKTYSIVLDVPPESDRIRIGMMLRGGGTVWMRNPKVETVEPGEKSTAQTFDPQRFMLDVLSTQPKNLLFDDESIMENHGDGVMSWSTHTHHTYHVRVDKQTVRNGKPSVRINCDSDPGDGFATISQSFDAKNYRGKRVRFNGYFKGAENKDWTALFMQINAGDRVVAFDSMQDRQTKDISDWTKGSIVLDVPPESTKIKIGYLRTGPGTVWLSNGSFEVVDSEVPTTSTSTLSEQLPHEKMDLEPNMSFD